MFQPYINEAFKKHPVVRGVVVKIMELVVKIYVKTGRDACSTRGRSVYAKNTVVSIGISPPIRSTLPWQQRQRK